ncbi:fumarylacetoacetate hydrolase family protein [Idiomarina xiamenensis]|uniref:Fumarylacetoacetate (FAA) hydrolase n=1 Tax=Idiomarina xiamenensis 10-D-4 TaxID=740709 RepID=K2K5G2_9GAMM|nr:fumarylacetoacetate hydrolase family protein [Idiomarina xiamenensis]EKE82818.1 fumarylacetoacetate (FAA) hydrolase [Idiomarina xiamenensis 10-D-4]
MAYQHLNRQGEALPLPVGKVVCVGRNYVAHAQELGNDIPAQPLLFIKPSTALVNLERGFQLPHGQGECQHECEISLLIGQPLKNADMASAAQAIAGISLGLDLTLREIQTQLRQAGQPWERAKAFDGACPMGRFIDPSCFSNCQNLTLALYVNGQLRQQGSSEQMIFSIVDLLVDISHVFSLQPGDIVMTGTPAGVAALHNGDKLELVLSDEQQQWRWQSYVGTP